eukprot:g19307.t1
MSSQANTGPPQTKPTLSPIRLAEEVQRAADEEILGIVVKTEARAVVREAVREVGKGIVQSLIVERFFDSAVADEVKKIAEEARSFLFHQRICEDRKAAVEKEAGVSRNSARGPRPQHNSRSTTPPEEIVIGPGGRCAGATTSAAARRVDHVEPPRRADPEHEHLINFYVAEAVLQLLFRKGRGVDAEKHFRDLRRREASFGDLQVDDVDPSARKTAPRQLSPGRGDRSARPAPAGKGKGQGKTQRNASSKFGKKPARGAHSSSPKTRSKLGAGGPNKKQSATDLDIELETTTYDDEQDIAARKIQRGFRRKSKDPHRILPVAGDLRISTSVGSDERRGALRATLLRVWHGTLYVLQVLLLSLHGGVCDFGECVLDLLNETLNVAAHNLCLSLNLEPGDGLLDQLGFVEEDPEAPEETWMEDGEEGELTSPPQHEMQMRAGVVEQSGGGGSSSGSDARQEEAVEGDENYYPGCSYLLPSAERRKQIFEDVKEFGRLFMQYEVQKRGAMLALGMYCAAYVAQLMVCLNNRVAECHARAELTCFGEEAEDLAEDLWEKSGKRLFGRGGNGTSGGGGANGSGMFVDEAGAGDGDRRAVPSALAPLVNELCEKRFEFLAQIIADEAAPYGGPPSGVKGEKRSAAWRELGMKFASLMEVSLSDEDMPGRTSANSSSSSDAGSSSSSTRFSCAATQAGARLRQIFLKPPCLQSRYDYSLAACKSKFVVPGSDLNHMGDPPTCPAPSESGAGPYADYSYGAARSALHMLQPLQVFHPLFRAMVYAVRMGKDGISPKAALSFAEELPYEDAMREFMLAEKAAASSYRRRGEGDEDRDKNAQTHLPQQHHLSVVDYFLQVLREKVLPSDWENDAFFREWHDCSNVVSPEKMQQLLTQAAAGESTCQGKRKSEKKNDADHTAEVEADQGVCEIPGPADAENDGNDRAEVEKRGSLNDGTPPGNKEGGAGTATWDKQALFHFVNGCLLTLLIYCTAWAPMEVGADLFAELVQALSAK